MKEKEPFKVDVVSIRLVKDAEIYSNEKIDKPYKIVEMLGEYMCELDREVMCIINLKTDNTPINCNFASVGALNQTLAHPREMLKAAILSNAAGMIMVHNHPSGRILPSKEDIQMTDRMLQVSELIGIPLLDHIIVGGKNKEYFSFHDKRLLRYPQKKYEEDYNNLIFPESHVAEERGR